MNLETPKKFRGLVTQAHQVAANYFRPISRKYDKAEHAYPQALDLLAARTHVPTSVAPLPLEQGVDALLTDRAGRTVLLGHAYSCLDQVG